MVNPIGALIGSLPYGAVAPTIERLPSIPEAAVRVTASGAALSSDSATSAPRQHNTGAAPIESLEQALQDVNDSLQAWSTSLRFDLDPEAQRLVVSVIDSTTGEVLRTVPTDAVIRVAKMIVKLQGQAVDTKV